MATQKFEKSTRVLVVVPEALVERIDAVLALVQKADWKGRPKVWTRSELLREGARRLVRDLERGRFRPLPDAERAGEATILEVRTPEGDT